MKEIETYLKIGSPCQIGNRIYFFSITFNGLFYLDIEELTIHFVHKFSVAKSNAVRLSKNNSLVYNNVLYFFPSYTNVIMEYDILGRQEHIIPIPDFKEKNLDISGIMKKGNLVYMFPAELRKGIYVLDLQKQKVEKDAELSSLFEQDFLCSSGLILYDNYDCVLIGMYGENKVIEVNLETKQIISSKCLEEICFYIMCFDGNHYWILPMESTDIYEWDRENDILQVYTNEHVEWRGKEYMNKMPYANIIFLEDEILVLNCFLKNILRIDKEKKTIGNPLEFPEGFRLANSQFSGWPVYARYTILEDKVLLYPYAGNMLLIYDKFTKQLSGRELLVSEKEVPYLRKILKENLADGKPWIECENFETLEEFVDMIGTNNKKGQSDNSEKIGRTIWSNCH